jgi:hypothetical protein
MIGDRPEAGFQMPDGQWLRGVSNGVNDTFQSVTALAGGGQAGATELSFNRAMSEIQTVVTANDSVALPYSAAGKRIKVYNSSANSANLYAKAGNNPLTGALDTINGATNPTAYAIGAKVAVEFFCPRDGIWAAIKSA